MKAIIKKFVCILCIAFFLFSCDKSEPIVSLQKILDGYDVRAIAFDSKGNAWIVTSEYEFKNGEITNIIRYNEEETVVYNYKNSVLPKDLSVWNIVVDKKDNVWICTSDGVWKYDGIVFSLYNSKNTPMPEDIVWTIAVDSENNIWMLSCRIRQGGLVKYDGKNWTVYTPNNSALPVNMINGITIDNSDNVWLALGEYVGQSYLVKISNDKWNVYDENDFGFNPYWYGGIQCDSKGRVLVAISYIFSSYMGPHFPDFFIFDGKNTTQLSKGNNISLSEINYFNDNVFCFGGVWSGEQWRPLNNSEFGWASGWLVKEDPYHRIWIGTENGIYIYAK